MSSSRVPPALALALFLTGCTGKPTPDGARSEPSPRQVPGASRPSSEAEGRAPEKPAESTVGRTAENLAASARALLDAAGTQRSKLAFGFDSEEREDWHYVPRSRKGLALGDMSEAQRGATHALLRAGLSPRGHEKVEGILLIEGILGQVEGSPDFRDPGRYQVAIFGQPGGDGPWGWRFEGHHLSLNFTQSGGHVATTPAFFGANPARVGAGRHRGLRVLRDEEDLGRALFVSLSGEQRRRAVLSASAPSDIVTEASRRVSLSGFEGLAAAEMSAAQRAALLRLVEIYVRNLQPDLASAHLERIKAAGVERLHFAWAGKVEPGQSHYYRVHGPTHLIEYDNRGGNHIHTVFRDLEHDFGEGLLARHLREDHGSKR